MQSPPDWVPHYGTSARLDQIQDIVAKELSLRRAPRTLKRPSYSVSADIPRTTRIEGLHADEIERISGAMHHLKRSGLPCAWAVIGDDALNLSEADAREVIRAFTSRIVRDQARACLPQYVLRVMESSGGIHANFVFPATPNMQRRLAASTAFRAYLKSDRAIQPVTDHERLVRFYLAKERPPVVRGGCRLGPRRTGSHRLGEGRGDRVILSLALRDDALAAGLIAPWRRTKANVLVRHQLVEPTTLVPINTMPRPEPVQLGLFAILPGDAPWVGSDLRLIRNGLGLTQDQMAKRLGIRDRSHIANIERRHDRLSPPRWRLLRHIIETEKHVA